MTKSELFKRIFELNAAGEEYCSKIPSEIRACFFDNPYATNREVVIDLLMKAYFTESEYESMNWFLYEWINNNNLSCFINGKEYKFSSIDEYISFLKEHENWV